MQFIISDKIQIIRFYLSLVRSVAYGESEVKLFACKEMINRKAKGEKWYDKLFNVKYLPLFHHFIAIYQFPKHIIFFVKIVDNASLKNLSLSNLGNTGFVFSCILNLSIFSFFLSKYFIFKHSSLVVCSVKYIYLRFIFILGYGCRHFVFKHFSVFCLHVFCFIHATYFLLVILNLDTLDVFTSMYMVSRHLFLIHLVFGHIFERGSFQYRLLSNVNSLLSMLIIVYAILATSSYKSFLCMCKGWSDAVDQRRTNKTMTKRKKRKGQTTVYKNITKKTKDWATRTPLMLLQEGKQCLFHYFHKNDVNMIW